MKQTKKELISYFENLNLLLIGIFLVVFPLIFLTTTTDAFMLPKQIALSITVALFVILFGLKAVIEGKLKLRNSPFDLAVVLFILVCFLSALFSINRFDALVAFVPLLFIGLLYFGIVNSVKSEKQLLFILASLVLGGILSGLISVFSYFKIYLLPFSYTHVPYFTTFGSLLDNAIYLALLLPITGYFTYSFVASLMSKKQTSSPFYKESARKKVDGLPLAFSIAFVLLLISLGVTIMQLFTPALRPIRLPFDAGLQTGLAAISQDSFRPVWLSFFFGSGIGTYIIDFTKYKPASFNLNSTLWAYTFFRSSSYFLELLATTGVLGVCSFLFLIFRVVKEKNFFIPLVVAIIAAFALPFSFSLIALFFIELAIFAVVRIQNNPEKFSEMELYMVTLKKGLLRILPEGNQAGQNATERRYGRFLPWVFFVFMIVVVGWPMWYAGQYVASDMIFQKSLVAASQNNATETYKLQADAMKVFPYRDTYYRAFSQTNLALAYSLAINQQKNDDKKNNAQVQQQIVTLIQQSITAGRNGATVAPLTAFNWNNLSSIYRSLIGFGQNADQFAIVTIQQALQLDPNNPQQYVELGGIYYQLGQYDEAMRNFQQAIKLKQDYANAYYNLGHALEQKGDLQSAMTMYQAVKTLVAKDEENTKKINEDINALTEKIGGAQKETAAKANVQAQAEENQQPIDVNKANAQLPEKNPKVKIPGPSDTPTPSKGETKNGNNPTGSAVKGTTGTR
jgi:tetratricopeptide (TPR) repeat protein